MNSDAWSYHSLASTLSQQIPRHNCIAWWNLVDSEQHDTAR